jgi:hypothetical protein
MPVHGHEARLEGRGRYPWALGGCSGSLGFLSLSQ